jgi:hypothetical protein
MFTSRIWEQANRVAKQLADRLLHISEIVRQKMPPLKVIRVRFDPRANACA